MVNSGTVTETIEQFKSFRLDLDLGDGLDFVNGLMELEQKELFTLLSQEEEDVMYKVLNAMRASVDQLDENKEEEINEH